MPGTSERLPMEPLIVSVGINGGELSREDTPYLPLTPAEIADSIIGAHAAGASIAHVHVRDEQGRPSDDPALFRGVTERVRERCDIILNLSTDVRHDGFASLDVGPEIASFPGGTVNYGDGVLMATMPVLRTLARRMRDAGTRPELEIWHEGMIEQCQQLAAEGLLDEPRFYQFILGMAWGAPADPRTLLRMVDSIPRGAVWCVCGVGHSAVPMALHAIPLGGHVRVGIEDSIEYLPGQLAESNAQLVERIRRIAEEAGRPLASPAQARGILGLRAREAVAE
jgi:3-keto-5-aminohexanoate cleavage enzyme